MEKWSFIGLVSWLSKRTVRAFSHWGVGGVGEGSGGGRTAERGTSASAEKQCTRERFSGTEDSLACRIFQSSPVVDYYHFFIVTLPSTIKTTSRWPLSASLPI